MKRNNLAHMRPVTQLQTQFPLWACFLFCFTLPKINIAPDNRQSPKETIVLPPSIFRCENVSFRIRIHVFLLILGWGSLFLRGKALQWRHGMSLLKVLEEHRLHSDMLTIESVLLSCTSARWRQLSVHLWSEYKRYLITATVYLDGGFKYVLFSSLLGEDS